MVSVHVAAASFRRDRSAMGLNGCSPRLLSMSVVNPEAANALPLTQAG
jgi:hypothetical protein